MRKEKLIPTFITGCVIGFFFWFIAFCLMSAEEMPDVGFISGLVGLCGFTLGAVIEYFGNYAPEMC